MTQQREPEPIFGVTRGGHPLLYRAFTWLALIGLTLVVIAMTVWGVVRALAPI